MQLLCPMAVHEADARTLGCHLLLSYDMKYGVYGVYGVYDVCVVYMT